MQTTPFKIDLEEKSPLDKGNEKAQTYEKSSHSEDESEIRIEDYHQPSDEVIQDVVTKKVFVPKWLSALG